MTAAEVQVRVAQPGDAAACAAIYAPYVRDTAITFETEPPTPAQMRERIDAASQTHTWIVAEQDSTVIGYAYGGPFAARPAYRWSCESSVYLDPGQRGRGVGTQLYRPLLDRLRQRGFHTAVAKITLPNRVSLAMHAAFGFQTVGVHQRIGYKNGDWHDVWHGQLELTPSRGHPEPLH